jgi:hypothetical protein
MKAKKATAQKVVKDNIPPQVVGEPLNPVVGKAVDASATHSSALVQDWLENSLFRSIREGWLTKGRRSKAVFHVLGNLSSENILPTMTIHAPEFHSMGCVHQSTPSGVFMYLSPTLEFESQGRVDFVVAHEFAHVVLRHHEPGNEQAALKADTYQNRPAEVAANALAESWGFKRSKRDGKFGKLLQWIAGELPITTAKHILQLLKEG